MSEEEKRKIEEYIKDNMNKEQNIIEEIRSLAKNPNIKNLLIDIGIPLLSTIMGVCGSLMPGMSAAAHNDDMKVKLTAWMREQREGKSSFPSVLKKYLKEKGYEDAHPAFYNSILMDRRLFSKLIREEKPYHPDERTVYKLSIGLKQTLDEAQELLLSAGYMFNNYQNISLIIKYCIENKIYDIDKVDEYLIMFGEKPLFSLE